MNLDFLNIQKETVEEFELIANKLLNEYAIQTHDATYRITEIEFYWNSEKFTDKCVYERKHVDPETGSWFFHYSGIDIALRNDELKGHGGILIRRIYNIESRDSHSGPQVCTMKLFSGTSVFSKSIQTRIIAKKFEKKKLIKGPRVGLGENAKASGTDKLLYGFSIDPR